MKIWVDADACPVAVKDIIVHASHRRKINTVFVANKDMLVPDSPLISFVRVASTPDAADQYIQTHAESGDLVVTQDIPLAHVLVPMKVVVINPRGEKYTSENIGERLSIRDFMQERRDSGDITGGPKQFGEKEKRAFAATFDRELTRMLM